LVYWLAPISGSYLGPGAFFELLTADP